MLVKKYKIGNTEIEIHDDAYKDKTKEDIDKILRRIEAIGSRTLYKNNRQAEAEKA
jgi:hypothetical protein